MLAENSADMQNVWWVGFRLQIQMAGVGELISVRLVLRWKRARGFECFDQTGSAIDKNFTIHKAFAEQTHHKHRPANTMLLFFYTNALVTRDQQVANSPTSRRSSNCLQIVYTDVSEHGIITTGRFLGPLPQACIGGGS